MRYLVPVSILVAAAALTQPAAAAQITVIVSASVAKPVELTKLQDLNFGTLILSGFSGTRVVAMSQAGVVTCPANIICSGTPTPARFNVQGSNKTVVPITVSASTMSNGTDTISFTPNAPASITLANSGAPGTDFTIGGSITVAPTVGGGLYSGTMNVTAENP